MDSHALLTLTVLAALCSTGALAKTASTIFTPERVGNARRNIERYEWAQRIRDKAVAEAENYAAQPDDILWELVTPQDIPRGIEVNRGGCPKCGEAVNRFGNYPWKVDALAKPWKIECPSCGEVFPKNDFAKFYESGKDERGVFHRDRADRSLLFNADHPDPNDPLHTYAVDDGLGWKAKDGQVYRFIGYYGHYGSWAAAIAALRSLSTAYVYTGDTRYARKAGLILYRVAEFYPSMDWTPLLALGFFNSHGGSGKGKVYGRIWETGVASTFITTYDAVYPVVGDSELLKYLSNRTGKRVTARTVRSLIEKNIIHEVHDGILRGDIAGNEGMHQYTMALAAVVLDEPGTSDKWLDWLFAPGDARRGNPNGGGIQDIFKNKINDDGMGDEASPGYNAIWRGKFRAVADLLDLYPRYNGPKIRDFPKYRRMFEVPVRIICLDRFIPNIGDCGKTGAPGTGGIKTEELVYAFRAFKDPKLAQMAHYLHTITGEPLRGGICDAEPDASGEIEAVVKQHGPYVPPTEDMPSYGLAILRGGSGEHRRALSVYYGSNTGHGHRDTLNFELFGFGLDLLPDLGYPEYATVWAPRYEWTANTISHNTVTIDRTQQRSQRLGIARFVKQGTGASAAEVYAGKPYPQASLYQRTIAMVDVSEKDFYVVDIFRAKGGSEHHYSLHGPEGEVTTEGLNLVAQPAGTLAGEDVAYGADLGGKDAGWADASGFQYLYDIRRDLKPSPQPSITWKVKDTWGVHKDPRDIRLRMTVVSPPGEMILAHGDPPQNKPGNPRRLQYVILPHASSESTFVTLIEPTEGDRAVTRIERTDQGDTAILRVTLASGRVDYIISSTEPRTTQVDGHEFTGRFGVLSEKGGRIETRLAVD